MSFLPVVALAFEDRPVSQSGSKCLVGFEFWWRVNSFHYTCMKIVLFYIFLFILFRKDTKALSINTCLCVVRLTETCYKKY